MKNPNVTHENWDVPPYNRWALQNMDQIVKTAPISRGDGPIYHLSRSECNVDDLPLFRVDGSAATVKDVLDSTYTDGFLVLHKGSIICEQYFNDMESNTRHLSQSMAKSITATLAGVYVGKGLIDTGLLVSHYVPQLSQCGYDGATVQQVLDMRSGVRFIEDYSDLENEMFYLDRASGWKPRHDKSFPSTIYDFILTLVKDREHGLDFSYRSIETEIIAWICEKVGGDKVPALYAKEIWSKLGAEHDALFTVDSDGTPLADGGFNATLRDYGRFGLMQLYEGKFNGNQIVPQAWVKSCKTGDQEVFRHGGTSMLEFYPDACYSNQWWVLDRDKGIFSARGANGQLIYMDPMHELVVVKLSSQPEFINDEMAYDTQRAINAITEHIMPDL